MTEETRNLEQAEKRFADLLSEMDDALEELDTARKEHEEADWRPTW